MEESKESTTVDGCLNLEVFPVQGFLQTEQGHDAGSIEGTGRVDLRRSEGRLATMLGFHRHVLYFGADDTRDVCRVVVAQPLPLPCEAIRGNNHPRDRRTLQEFQRKK
jgi:hypothetical protein